MDNGGIDYDKLLEQQFHGIVYYIQIKATSSMLSIDLENKQTGDVWCNTFTAQAIQSLTKKVNNFKKYSVFVKMLIASLTSKTDSVCVDVQSSQELQMLKQGKGFINKSNVVQNGGKKFMILTYLSQFDKVHYPLHLNYEENHNIERLKLTIRRLNQQLRSNYSGNNPQNLYKQLSIIKHQNQLLKLKLSNNISEMSQSYQRSFYKENENSQNYEHTLHDKNKEIEMLKNQINGMVKDFQALKIKFKETDKICQGLKEELQEKNQQLNQENAKVMSLKRQLETLKQKQNHRQQNKFEDKLNEIQKQSEELVRKLQHSHEQSKKDKLKIQHLEQQLQNMMKLNANKRRQQTLQSSIQKNQRSERSQRSQSQSKKKVYGEKDKYKNIKKSSVYDSDTQSSRMRRMNNRVSPFRQSNGLNKINKNLVDNSAKKTPSKQQLATRINRSKSKSVKKEESPKTVQMSEVGGYDSDSEQNEIAQMVNRLRDRNKTMNNVKMLDKRLKNSTHNDKKETQKRISSIAEMLRKSKQSYNKP